MQTLFCSGKSKNRIGVKMPLPRTTSSHSPNFRIFLIKYLVQFFIIIEDNIVLIGPLNPAWNGADTASKRAFF